jgi:hypothetical protein
LERYNYISAGIEISRLNLGSLKPPFQNSSASRVIEFFFAAAFNNHGFADASVFIQDDAEPYFAGIALQRCIQRVGRFGRFSPIGTRASCKIRAAEENAYKNEVRGSFY